MPTVHLSLPEALYERLRETAEEMGIQVTDLIKLYIKQGLESSGNSRQKDSTEKRIEAIEENVLYLMAMYSQLNVMLSEVLKKLKEPDVEKIEMLGKK